MAASSLTRPSMSPKLASPTHRRGCCRPGTVCLSRTASVGYVIQMGVEMCTSQDFVNWVCGPDLNPAYLRYILMFEQESIRRFAHGTTHQTMYYPEAKALHAMMPSRLIPGLGG